MHMIVSLLITSTSFTVAHSHALASQPVMAAGYTVMVTTDPDHAACAIKMKKCEQLPNKRLQCRQRFTTMPYIHQWPAQDSEATSAATAAIHD